MAFQSRSTVRVFALRRNDFDLAKSRPENVPAVPPHAQGLAAQHGDDRAGGNHSIFDMLLLTAESRSSYFAVTTIEKRSDKSS
jgi:hypothetical protein